MPERRYEEFLDRIIDILKKDLKVEPVITPTEFKGIAIDMPRKGEERYHGSSYEILCNRTYTWCKIRGDLVVGTENEDITHKDIEKSDCRVFEVHKHRSHKEGEEDKVESHIHFMCMDKDREGTLRMINFLKSR